MSDRIEQFLEEHATGDGVHDYPAAVDALVAAGLLELDRAELWKAEHVRLRAAARSHEGPYDEEIETKAIELLEDLFAPVRPRAGDDWDPVAYQRYQEALMTLTIVGALSRERAQPWQQRGREMFTPAGGWPKRERQPEPEIAFAAGELSAVLTGPAERLDGMRVTCLELYGDCVIVRFHQLLPAEPADPVERRRYLSAAFDLVVDGGSSYRAATIPEPRGCPPREIQGWPEVLVGWQAFVPGAPLDARAFTLSWREQRFELRLDDGPTP